MHHQGLLKAAVGYEGPLSLVLNIIFIVIMVPVSSQILSWRIKEHEATTTKHIFRYIRRAETLFLFVTYIYIYNIFYLLRKNKKERASRNRSVTEIRNEEDTHVR